MQLLIHVASVNTEGRRKLNATNQWQAVSLLVKMPEAARVSPGKETQTSVLFSHKNILGLTSGWGKYHSPKQFLGTVWGLGPISDHSWQLMNAHPVSKGDLL